MAILRSDNLCKSYGGVQALGGVTLERSSPDIVALIGPNGAGKTTLLNVITGFLAADAGHCFLDGYETTHLRPHQIARLGIARTFQDLRLLQQVSVLDNVLLARPRQRGERFWSALVGWGVVADEKCQRKASLSLLEFVGLENKSHTLAGELSYGEQKLLSLACCVATEAGVLLLDEPIAGVHPQRAEQILGLLRSLRGAGKLIIFIEHDLTFVREIADHVLVMDGGQLIAQGLPTEVLARPEIVEAYIA